MVAERTGMPKEDTRDTGGSQAVGKWEQNYPRWREGVPEEKELPYQPLYHHHYWFIDIRYLVQRDGNWVYSICILEGYSRKILAGMAGLLHLKIRQLAAIEAFAS
jgi:hypothetical protein